jgi:hypothetical protein
MFYINTVILAKKDFAVFDGLHPLFLHWDEEIFIGIQVSSSASETFIGLPLFRLVFQYAFSIRTMQRTFCMNTFVVKGKYYVYQDVTPSEEEMVLFAALPLSGYPPVGI